MSELFKFTELRYNMLPILTDSIRDGDDPLGTLLRVHLFAESVMDKLIHISFSEKTNAILSLNLSFKQKMDLTSKLMIVDDVPLISDLTVGSLRKLNKLRNKHAHEFNSELKNRDVLELFMGEGLPYGDLERADININLKRYSYFIFGHMLPKFDVA